VAPSPGLAHSAKWPSLYSHGGVSGGIAEQACQAPITLSCLGEASATLPSSNPVFPALRSTSSYKSIASKL